MKYFILLCVLSALVHAQNKTYYYDEQPVVPLTKNHPCTILDNITTTYWSKEFSVPGINGYIYTLASDGSNLYIGGSFNTAGNVIARNIVKWDGQTWSSIGEGMENGVNAAVHAIAWLNGKLFVGGLFSKAGSLSVNGIAYWDGYKWNSLGNDSTNGIRRILDMGNDSTLIETGFTYSLYPFDNKLYVGGYFHLAGTDITQGVAVWNTITETWENMKGGLKSTIPGDQVYAYSFIGNGNNIYVGGKFHIAGGVPTMNIARWDGNQWSHWGNANGWVFDLETDPKGNIYAAGTFDSVSNVKASGTAKWNGTYWESLGELEFAPSDAKPFIKQICHYNGNIFIGGIFDKAGENYANSFAKWDGSQWQIITGLGQAVNDFFNGSITGLQVINNRLFVGGYFTKAGELLMSNIVEWDESADTWKKIPGGNSDNGIYDGYITALAASADALYAGGSFTIAGGIYSRNIAKWNNGKWESLGESYNNGIRGSIYTILADSSGVYIGGHFGSAGIVEAYHIARWDGINWSRIGIGVGGVSGASVYALAKDGDYLYAGGYFSVVGDEENYELPANSIARFNLKSNRWETLGKGIEYVSGIPGTVYSLEKADNRIYVGGRFNSADDNFFPNVAMLENNKWSTIDGKNDLGIDGIVLSLKRINKELYVGGIFEVDDKLVSLAKWDGIRLSEISGGIQSTKASPVIRSIIPYEKGFITAGRFDIAGDKTVSNIAFYDGTEWQDLDGGLNDDVNSLAFYEGSLYVGGGFTSTAGFASNAIASYDLNATSVHTENKITNYHLFNNYPNPFNPITNITFSIPEVTRVKLVIYDILGKHVSVLLDEEKEPGTHKVRFNGDPLPSGVYFYQMITPNFTTSGKMILQK